MSALDKYLSDDDGQPWDAEKVERVRDAALAELTALRAKAALADEHAYAVYALTNLGTVSKRETLWLERYEAIK